MLIHRTKNCGRLRNVRLYVQILSELEKANPICPPSGLSSKNIKKYFSFNLKDFKLAGLKSKS